MNKINVDIYAGDERTINLVARDYSNDIKDISGLTLTFRVGKPGLDALFEKACTVVSAAAGTFTVALVAADTAEMSGDYVYQVRAASGSAETTVLSGRFRVIPVVENT